KAPDDSRRDSAGLYRRGQRQAPKAAIADGAATGAGGMRQKMGRIATRERRRPDRPIVAVVATQKARWAMGCSRLPAICQDLGRHWRRKRNNGPPPAARPDAMLPL
ncbi:MAG TPA: hypothetical protein VLA78_02235, partial [Paracoccaceae bacterium]|nr:hypothetical protein [Paracoccaceae bacterium]